MTETIRDKLRALAERYGTSPDKLRERFIEEVDRGAGAESALAEIVRMLEGEAVPLKGAEPTRDLKAFMPEKPEERAKRRSKAEEYRRFRETAGNFVTPKDVEEGQELEIVDGGSMDDTTFDRPYWVLKVRVGDAVKDLRIGVKNSDRIAADLGTKDPAEWTGRRLKVKAIEYYEHFGREGLILGGVK